MSKKKLKFNNVEVNKKEFHASKQPVALNLVNAHQIVVSETFEHNNTGFNHFVAYKDDHIIRPLYIILPKISGYIN